MPAIDALIEQLGTDLEGTKRAIPLFKQALQDCNTDLTKRFYAHEDIERLVHDRARFHGPAVATRLASL